MEIKKKLNYFGNFTTAVKIPDLWSDTPYGASENNFLQTQNIYNFIQFYQHKKRGHHFQVTDYPLPVHLPKHESLTAF